MADPKPLPVREVVDIDGDFIRYEATPPEAADPPAREPTADPGEPSRKDWEKERAISQQRSLDRYGYVLPMTDPGEDAELRRDLAASRDELAEMAREWSVVDGDGLDADDEAADLPTREPTADTGEDRTVPPPGWKWYGTPGTAVMPVRGIDGVGALYLADAWRIADAITAPLRARIAELEADRDEWKERSELQFIALEMTRGERAERDAALRRAAEHEALLTAQCKATDYACADNVKLRALLAECEPVVRMCAFQHRGDLLGQLLKRIRALTTPGDETT